MKNGHGETDGRANHELRFVIVGCGMAGILSAVRLREAGFTNFTVYEKAERLGGTWRENTYPGIACDVPSHLYCYSFAQNPDWSHVFSPGSEILAYLEDVARQHDVYRHVRFGAEIRRMELRKGRWHIDTADGQHDAADFVIAATGVLHHPSYPDIDGLDTFAGARFHSARWDHGVSLVGKRMGIIGSGSTSVQIVSATIGTVAQLHLFQRTPQWILPMANPAIDDTDKERFRHDPVKLHARRDELAQSFAANFANAVVDASSPQLKMLEQICRANLEDNVKDAQLREKLRPDYRVACKRLVVSPDFYDAMQRPNARLVTEGIERIEAKGVRTKDGQLHELDVLVLATGFRVDRFMRPIEVVGGDGVTLENIWSERPSAYLAISIPELPNLFMLNGPNGPVGNFSLIDVAELQFAYIMQLVQLVRVGRCRQIAASRYAADRFEAQRVDAAKQTVWVTGCRSWYLDDRGVPAAWPWSFDRFREEMAQPNLDDYELLG